MTNSNLYRSSDLVAGATAEGYGLLVGWQGLGEMTRARLTDIVTPVAGFEAAWLPAAKEPGTQLTSAIHSAQGNLYSAERVAKSTWSAETEPREWSSRWLLVSRAGSSDIAIGAAFGQVALVATLYIEASGHELVIDGNPALAAIVRADFEARIASAMYKASDVTAWLAGVMANRLDAVKLGGCWYLPRRTKTLGANLCEAFRSSGWGRAWMNPPLPIATTGEAVAGIAQGLADEAGEIAAEVEAERADRVAAGHLDIGTRKAEGFIERMRSLGKRMFRHADLLGDALSVCHAGLCDAMISLTSILPDLNPEREWAAIAATCEPVIEVEDRTPTVDEDERAMYRNPNSAASRDARRSDDR